MLLSADFDHLEMKKSRSMNSLQRNELVFDGIVFILPLNIFAWFVKNVVASSTVFSTTYPVPTDT